MLNIADTIERRIEFAFDQLDLQGGRVRPACSAACIARMLGKRKLYRAAESERGSRLSIVRAGSSRVGSTPITWR